MPAVLLRLTYLAIVNVLVMLRLSSMSESAKDVEILVLRHQIGVLERQLHGDRPRFAAVDRAWLAALLHRLPRGVLHRVRLLVRPDTVLRWHRDLLPDATQGSPGPNVPAARGRCNRFACWCCGWPARTARGAIEGYTGSCWCSA